jgi:hypothetical protein
VSGLTTEWSADDPKVAEVLRQVASYPEGSVEHAELMAVLHAWQAAHYQRLAGALAETKRQNAAMSAHGRKAAAARRVGR